ncbi:50S ribosomal protein L13 [Elusimicrobiota bacterium]
MKNGKSYLPKAEEIKRKWHFIDADGQVLGRLAVRVAALLTGKRKAIYTSSVDCGDFVVLTNLSKLVLTGRKLEQKTAFSYSGYPGGGKLVPYAKLMQENPDKAFRIAVKGMLPKNKLADKQLTRMKMFKGAEHTHQSQIEK